MCSGTGVGETKTKQTFKTEHNYINNISGPGFENNLIRNPFREYCDYFLERPCLN